MTILTNRHQQLDITYRFHPVGQGLFASGRIQYEYPLGRWTPPAFSWVYDCGTNSSRNKCLIPELNHLAAEALLFGSPLNLVTLSHFDSDHINGLTELLERFSVETLLLPLVPLWKRLELAFMDDASLGSKAMSFYLNPVSYLLRHFPQRIHSIVLVPPASPEPQNDLAEQGTPKNWVEDGRSHVDTANQLPHEISEELRELSPDELSRVRLLMPQGTIQVSRFWEFLPYNDMHLCPKPLHSFVAAVNSRRNELLDSTAPKHIRSQSLNNLKAQYSLLIGQSALARNRISLFLYAGPIGNTAVTQAVRSTFMRPAGLETKANINLPFSRNVHTRLSVLYTGDGYLSDQRSVDALFEYLGPDRLANLACLQVPHHGARSNWAPGHAARFAPDIAVFCSDPTRKSLGHPHREVIDDFSSHASVSVDKTQGAVVEGKLVVL